MTINEVDVNQEEQEPSYIDNQETETNDFGTANKPELNKDYLDRENYSDNKLELSQDEVFHNQILEKLDILKKETKQNIVEKSKQESLDSIKSKSQLENILKQDFEKIQILIKSGLISSEQGQNLKKEVLKKAFDGLVQAEKIKRKLTPALDYKTTINQNKIQGINEFSKSSPDFFSSDGRKEVLNYLKSSNANLGKDEINRISEIIRIVEKSAIEGYLQKVAHEKNIRESNETAKQRLKASAQKTGFSGNLSRSFTREQIGKMSSTEFARYEPIIMEQLKKGRIK